MKIFLVFIWSFILISGYAVRPDQNRQAELSDDAAIRALVARCFTAYRLKNEKGLASLWSNKASGEALKMRLPGLDEGPDPNAIQVVGVRQNGDNAAVRVDVASNSVALDRQKPQNSKMVKLTLHLVKEGGEWKLLKAALSEQDLAARIAAAKSAQERDALLTADRDLVTIELDAALLAESGGLLRKGSFPEASDLLQFTSVLAARFGDNRSLAICYGNMGRCSELAGNYSQALEYAKKTIEAARQTSDKGLLCHALWAAGFDEQILGNFTESREYLQESLKISEPRGDTRNTSYAMMNLAAVDSREGHYSEALNELVRSLDLAQKAGDNALAGACLHDLGVLEFHQGNMAQALDYFQRGLKTSRAAGNQQSVAMALDEIGSVEGFLGNIPEALKDYQESLDLSRSLGDKEHIAVTLHNLGSVYNGRHDYENALRCHTESIAIARETGDKVMLADTLSNVADIYCLQGRFDEAVKTAEEAASIAERIGEVEVLADARTVEGRAYRSLRQPDAARRSLAEAIDAVEKLRSQVAGAEEDRQRYLALRITPYREMAGMLVDQHHPFEALGYAEQAKARTLVEVLQPGRDRITKSMTSEEKEKEGSLIDRLTVLNARIVSERSQRQPDDKKIAGLNSELGKAQLEFDRFEADLKVAHPELSSQRGDFQRITRSQLASLIPGPNAALLEYLVTEDRTYLFALTRRDGAQDDIDIKVFEISATRDGLKARVERYRNALGNRDLDFGEQSLALYDLLLKPAAPVLKGKNEVVIVPDDVLWSMPFQALESKRGRFAIEDYAISYAPSFTALREMSRLELARASSPAPPIDLLAMGNPTIGKQTSETVRETYRDARLEPLPMAEQEVETLGKEYGAGRSRVYVEGEATEERLKADAGRCLILHLATHGILNDSNPLHSQIVLARAADGKDDGVLEAWEIMNLNLRAELVVLSACDTGQGAIRAGEGMIGLSWAVFVAGCPTTVVSQWKVESASTTELMIDFHKELLAGKSKTEALRNAEISLLKNPKYRNPFYWAPFVVVGKAD